MLKKLIICMITAVIFLCGEGLLMAQSAEIELKEIDVRGQLRREELESTSATILENKDIVDRIYQSPLYMLRQAPGVKISEYSEQGVASSVNIRGFGGGHNSDVAFYMDGIPLNDGGHSDAYADTTIIIPLEIESLEIIKGPASALYGRGSAGGVASFQSIKSGDFTRANIRYGTSNTIDGQGVIARDDGSLHHVYAFQLYHTDGWRDNSEWDRMNLSTRWTYDVSDQLKISLNFRAATAEWDTGYSVANWMDPKTAVDDGSGKGNLNGGHRDRYDGRFWANYLINNESQLTFYVFGTHLENNMAQIEWASATPGQQYLKYINPTKPEDLESGEDQTNTRKAFGTGLVYNYKDQIFNDHDFSFTLGTDYLSENEHRQLYTLKWGSGNTHQGQFGDTHYTFKTLSLYTDLNYQISEMFRIRLGSRYDNYSGELDTGPKQKSNKVLDPNQHYKAKSRGVWSPKAGLIFYPFENTEIYTNYGRGYSLPYLNNGDFFARDELKLSERDQFELGFRSSPLDWLDVGLVAYLVNTKNDQILNPDKTIAVYENAGQTRRKGIESYVKFYPIENLTFALDYTFQEAKYTNNELKPYLNGHRLTQVPKHILNAELTYVPPEGLGGRASFNWNADMAWRDDPSQSIEYYKGEDYGTLDLQLNYRFDQRWKINLDVTNVLNNRPKNGVPNGDGYWFYWAQAPTAAYLTLELDY